MPAEDRAREPGALPSAPVETEVSMQDLLASCAAADAVSKPPSEATAAVPTEAEGQAPDDEEAGRAA